MNIVDNVPMPETHDGEDNFNEVPTDNRHKLVAKKIKEDIDAHALEKWGEPYRTRLGVSKIGHECEAFLWLGFRWTYKDIPSGRQQRVFQRGHREEEWLISLLEAIGCEVLQTNPETGKQFRFSKVDGHFGGSIDFKVKLPTRYGIDEWLVGECKTSSTGKPFNELSNGGLSEAKPMHVDQNDCYGAEFGLKKGLYVCTNKNDDDLYIEIRDIDCENAERLFEKANGIIHAVELPARISSSKTYFKCKYCPARKVCHDGDEPEKNCRSCYNAKPVENGEWFCGKFNANIPKEFIPQGCGDWDAIINN